MAKVSESSTARAPGDVEVRLHIHAFALQGSNIICLGCMLLVLVAAEVDLAMQFSDPEMGFVPVCREACMPYVQLLLLRHTCIFRKIANGPATPPVLCHTPVIR